MKQLWTEKAIGLAALISVWLLTAFSNTIATRAGTYITLIKVILVLFVIATGIAAGVGAIASPYKPLPSPSNFASIQRSFEGTATDPGAYATALYMVFFCYDGWSMLSTSVGELKDPVRNIPKAMLMGMSGIAVLYLGVNLSYFLVLSREQMVESGDLLAFVWADAVFGPVCKFLKQWRVKMVCILLSLSIKKMFLS